MVICVNVSHAWHGCSGEDIYGYLDVQLHIDVKMMLLAN